MRDADISSMFLQFCVHTTGLQFCNFRFKATWPAVGQLRVHRLHTMAFRPLVKNMVL